MVARVKLAQKQEGGGLYFPPPKGVICIPSGCTLLDCVLGGGYALGRVVNIVGDKAVGKTLLAIEACANFARKYPKGKIFYREAEAAFDVDYAANLGLPEERVDFGKEGIETQWQTVEDIFEDLEVQLTKLEKSGGAGLYIIDSLDALSSRAELLRKVDQGSYGQEKPKLLSRLFRQYSRRIKATNLCIIVISQIRDKIGITFGEKYSRTGGHALDFYASQIVWLSHIKTLTREIRGVKRATGVQIKAKCKKNKVGLPFRECYFEITFGYGIQDAEASVDWLEEVKALDRLGMKASEVDAFLARMTKLTGEELLASRRLLSEAVIAAWQEVEGRFAPKQRKYG